jgi:hypothetical protein
VVLVASAVAGCPIIMSDKAMLKDAVMMKNMSLVGDIVRQTSSGCYKDVGSFDPFGVRELIDEAIVLIAEPALQSSAESFLLLRLFLSDWGQLNAEQRRRLLEQIDANCESFKDTTAIQVMMELLGGHFADEAAFLVLTRFSSSERVEVRALSCVGLVAIGVTSDSYYRKCLTILERLRFDAAELVKEEAGLALARLIRA